MANDPVPNFICPTCGAFSATTWADVVAPEAPAASETALLMGCGQLLGLILEDHARQYPFQVACLHPDGTFSYRPEGAPDVKGTPRVVEVTPELAAEVAAMPDIREYLPDRTIEQRIYRTLGSLLYCQEQFLVSGTIPLSTHYPDVVFSLLDDLAGLSDASPLAHHYASHDLDFTALQAQVLELIQDYYFTVADLDECLWYAPHCMTPTEIRAALAAQNDDEDASGEP